MLLNLPQNITAILDRLEESGFEAYAVGGCVRDLLMGHAPHDYDITTNALPEQIKGIFPHTADTGLKHGTVTVIWDKEAVEVTTYRTEGGYSDGRHPDRVQFVSDITADLSRRDFTVNAIGYSKLRGLCDPYGGQEDIKSGILRAVGDPEKRFREDYLRIMRLFRFSSRLGFTPEEKTLSAAIKHSGGLIHVSPERIAAELIKMVCGRFPALSEPLLKSGALKFIGINGCGGLERLSGLPEKAELRLFALMTLCDCDINAVTKRLKYSGHICGYCSDMERLISQIPKSRTEIKTALKDFKRECVFDSFEYAKAVLGRDCSKERAEAESIISSGEPYTLSGLALNGRDLEVLGLTGADIGKALNSLLEAVIQDPSLNTKNRLLKKLDRN